MARGREGGQRSRQTAFAGRQRGKAPFYELLVKEGKLATGAEEGIDARGCVSIRRKEKKARGWEENLAITFLSGASAGSWNCSPFRWNLRPGVECENT